MGEMTEQGMICEICREAVATVHLTEIVNNSKKEIHLCEECAQQKGVAIQTHIKNFSIPEFFGNLVEPKEAGDGEQEDLLCHQCGLSHRHFRTTGKLGCPNDYRVFGKELTQLLEKIHGSVQHRGKVPNRVDRENILQKEIEELKLELRHAVEHEEYEHAATLRDRIHEMERGAGCS